MIRDDEGKPLPQADEKLWLKKQYVAIADTPAFKHFHSHIESLIEKCNKIKNYKPSDTDEIIARGVRQDRTKHDCYSNLLNTIKRLLSGQGV